MEDFYQNGFDEGYGGYITDNHESPCTDGEQYDYRQGVEDGNRRREISDELESEGW